MADRDRIAGLGGGFEAVVLAGGLGARIRSVAADRPKVMIEIAGRPFLEILLERLEAGGLTRVILATGYLHSMVESHFGTRFRNIEIVYARESQPLGTGGAVWNALRSATQDDVLVCNGDTFFDVDLRAFYQFHLSMKSDASMALKRMRNFDRYGTVQIDKERIVGFREKQPAQEGWINGGVYLLHRPSLRRFPMPGKFSIESDFFEKCVKQLRIGAFVSDAYFIDIGIPEDCARAQIELQKDGKRQE
jgi:D-glycero-alpha-D-manno-heptose 1-phosphate guanylyltransferase